MLKQFHEKLHLLRSNTIEKTNMIQRVIFFGVLGTVMVSVVGVLIYKSYANNTRTSQKAENAPRKEKRIKIESGGAALSSQEIWVDRLEKEQALLNRRFESMEKIVKELAHEKLVSGHPTGFQNEQTQKHETISAESLVPLHNTLDSTSLHENTKGPQHISPVLSPVGDKNVKKETQSSADEPAANPVKLQRVTFSVDTLSSKKIKKSVDHYVPAGSFVRGRLTSGVVAPTSVQASSNPQPIHIELTNLGNLPRGFKTDVKQCFLIGSAYGDLSSERVLMRLETLSCVERKTEEIIELDVDGFVTGEDGANGLRGILVDRTGPAMRSAFVGGFLSGVGNFFGQQQTSVPTMINPGGVTSFNPLSAQHMLQGGAGKGVGNAMEKLSDFYIKRAEQLQPVLEVEPGRLVHVVFKKGFDMNQTVYRQSLMNMNDHNRRDAAERVGADTQQEPHL